MQTVRTIGGHGRIEQAMEELQGTRPVLQGVSLLVEREGQRLDAGSEEVRDDADVREMGEVREESGCCPVNVTIEAQTSSKLCLHVCPRARHPLRPMEEAQRDTHPSALCSLTASRMSW